MQEAQFGLSSMIRSKNHSGERNFFIFIMVLIELCLLMRIPFFSIIFVDQDNEYKYALITGPLPSVFKYLIVLFICKYKLHVLYIYGRRKGQFWVRMVILFLEVLAVSIPWIVQVLECKNSSTAKNYVGGLAVCIELSFIIGLSVFSLTLSIKMSRAMGFV